MGNPTVFADAPEPQQWRGRTDAALDATPSGAAEGAAPLRGEQPWPASLEPSCLRTLERLSTAGLALSEEPHAAVFTLCFGGEVPKDGSCLFAAVAQAAGVDCSVAELRHRCVKRVLADAGSGLLPPGVDATLHSTYSPDLVRAPPAVPACAQAAR
jgi:hypothetical protein